MEDQTNSQYELVLQSGEKITIRAIPRDGYRLVSTVAEFPEQPPMPVQINYFEPISDWIVDDDPENPLYEEAMARYDFYTNHLLALTQYESTLYVIENGVVGEPTSEEYEHLYLEEFAEDDSEAKMLWVLNKCANEHEYLDVIDDIVGINMPTESGVLSVIQSFQTMIVDGEIMVPLQNWKSEKERKGGVMMSLYAEGLMACAQLNGIITLEKYLSLPGGPQYADQNAEFPLSMSHIVAINRANNTSQGAVQEIEMRDDKEDENKTDKKDEEWLRKARFEE